MRIKNLVAIFTVAITLVTVGCGDKSPIEYAAQGSNTGDSATENLSVETESDKDFTPGVIKENTYEHAFFNVKISIPDDMSFFDNDELAEINDVASAYTSNETVKEAMEISRSSIVAYAAKDDGTTFNVSLSSAGKMTTAVFNERAVVEGSKQMTIDEFEGIGYSDIDAEVETTNFLGEEHYALVLKGNNPSGDYHVKAIALLKDGYIATFTVGSPSEEGLEILDNAVKISQS